MSANFLAMTLMILGLVVTLLFGLADVTGLGQSPGFGPGQIIGVLVGVLILASGLRVRNAGF